MNKSVLVVRPTQAEREVAFDELVRARRPALVATSALILGDPGNAEDVVQESLELAWRKWDSIRAPDKREQWLLQICVRRALTWRRRTLRRTALWHRLVSADTEAPLVNGPEDTDLALGFARCSSRQRAVLVLHFYHGYTLDECAGLLGCRPGTVRSHLARALATIRRSLR